MGAIFRKSGLIQSDELILDLSPEDFRKVLEFNLDPTGFKFFGVFSKSKNNFKGIVDDHSFTMYEKRSLFQLRSALISIDGHFENKNEKTLVSFTINGINNHFIFIYFLFFIFYCVGYSVIFRISDAQSFSNFPVYFSIALTAHMFLQVSAPIIAKKKKVEKFKKSLTYKFQEMITNYNSKPVLT